MIAQRAVILDNEPVDALMDVNHPKHRRALAIIEVLAARKRSHRLVVPTSVRVEAAWDRTAIRSAIINRLRVADHPLDADSANYAASIRAALDISTVDAHIAATLRSLGQTGVLVTSGVDAAQRIVGHTGIDATIVRL